MKKTLLLFFITSSLCYSQTCDFTPFDIALNDDSGSNTNVKHEPNGDLVLQLNKEDLFVLHVIDYKDGWLKIDNISSVYFGFDISNLEGWVHQSTTGFWTRKKIELLEAPKANKSIGSIDGENGPVKLIDVCANWVEIEFNGLKGWVELKWLCGNPVTTCP